MTIDLPPEERLPGLSLGFEDQDDVRGFARHDPGTADGTLTTGEFEVAEEGPIRISIRLVIDAATVTDGALEMKGREECRWSVNFASDTEDPTLNCFGCLGSVSIPVAEEHHTSPDEALWAFSSGRREGSDVVY